MKRLIQRILVALLLGFIASWVIPNLLLEIPRRIGTSQPIRFQTIIDTELKANRGFVNIFDYRWLGISEQQFTATRRFSTKNQRKMMELWWAWEASPGPTEPLAQAWVQARAGFDSARFEPGQSQFSIIKVGFPALSFVGEIAINAKSPMADGSLDVDSGGFFVLPINQPAMISKFAGTQSMPAAEHVWVPTRPIWSGLVLNTLFYALIFWILGSITRAYRHARRMHKGRCPMCSYELGFVFVDGCPECGWRKEGNKPGAGCRG